MTRDVTPEIGTWIEIVENTKQKQNNYSGLKAVSWGLSDSPDGLANNSMLVLKILSVKTKEKVLCKLNYNQYVFCVAAETKFDPVRTLNSPKIHILFSKFKIQSITLSKIYIYFSVILEHH